MIALKTIVFFICALLLFPVTAGSVEKVSDEKHIYTVIEFESTFMNRKKEKVLRVLGEPDLKWEHRGKEVWKYLRVIKDQDKIWNQNILFDFGRVNMMWGEASDEVGNQVSP